MLRVDTISALDEFFKSKKNVTLDAIGREASSATIDIYVRGFLRQVLERITDMCPELRQITVTEHNGPGGGFLKQQYMEGSELVTPTHKHFQSQPYMTGMPRPSIESKLPPQSP